jgi:outer membrane receptor protein involved in Fe transport
MLLGMTAIGALLQAEPALAAPAAAAAQAPQPAQLDAVVVTGSRIVRNGYAAPTPMTVAPIEQLQQTTPSSIPDGLNKLPQFSFSTFTAANGSVGGAPSVFGGNFLNLRAFGLPRTLILMDSRRVPSTSVNGLVDVNTLPQMLVQRVDVVTGGASAVYGSDAVTGVVNFVLDKHFNGLKAVAQYGTSTYGDANSYRLGVAGGGDITDRGHLIWSAERYQNNGIRAHEDRPWAASIPVYVGATGVGPVGSQTNPYTLVQNARTSNTSFGGLALTGPFRGQQFLPDGSLGAFNPGTATTVANLAIGGDGGYFTDVNMTSPTRTNQAFGRFEYQLASALTGYVQLGLAETQVLGQHASNATASTFTITNDNPYLTATEKALLGANSFTLSRLARDLAKDSTLDQMTDALNFTAGLTGSVFSKFNWDAYYTHGEARVRSRTNNNINYPNLYAAVDAVRDSSGNIVCRVSTTANAGLYPGCAPVDLFGVGNVSAAAKAFIYKNTRWQAVNKLDDFEANVSGPVFNNWAGPVSVALNAEYRSQSLAQVSSVDPLAVPSYSALQNKPPAGALGLNSVWAYNVQGASQGRNHVFETSAETVFPLLANAPLIKSLEANGAVRYTNYSTSGEAWTWKYGLNYQPTDDLRIRWTESRDIRAPTLNDLFAPPAILNVTVSDPFINQSYATLSRNGGNPNLVPEVARTTTAGFVYSPSFVPRLRMSVDYYNIDIANALSAVNGSQAAVLQECFNSNGTSPVCSVMGPRDPVTNRLTYVTNYTINAAQTYTHGVDVEASYNFDVADVLKSVPGRVDMRLLYAYQPSMKTRAYPTAVLVQSAGVAGNGGTVSFSVNRVTTDISYKLGAVTLNWQMRYYSGLALSGNPTQFYADPPLPSIFYHDIGLNYDFKAAGHSIQAFVTVDNLLNQTPRIWPGTSTASPGTSNPAVASDDMVGRYYTFGLRMKY